MSRLFLGVDGGQSSTTAMVGDETGCIVGFGRGSECNHVKGPAGRTKFINAINGCVGLAGFSGAQFEAACLGFSGGPADKEELLHQILQVTGQMTVTHDGLIALTGATAGVPGIIMIAGTGSFAFGRNAEGRSARAGERPPAAFKFDLRTSCCPAGKDHLPGTELSRARQGRRAAR